MGWKSFLASVILATHVTAAVYRTVDELPGLEYDFIIVGGMFYVSQKNISASRL